MQRPLARTVVAVLAVGIAAVDLAVVAVRAEPPAVAASASVPRLDTRRSPVVLTPQVATPPAPTGPAALPPLAALLEARVLVHLPHAATPAELAAATAVRGVDGVAVLDEGTVDVAGAAAHAFGVDPASFRPFTADRLAHADLVWQNVAAGALAASFDLGQRQHLQLGSDVPVAPAQQPAMPRRLGALLGAPLPGADVLVSHDVAATLGLVPQSALVVSATSATNTWDVHQALAAALPGARLDLLTPGVVVSGAPGGLPSPQLSTALAAAFSRLGLPYVWGATGPDRFDCSGLVQWAFRAAGVQLPRTAGEQRAATRPVSPDQARPGDLLFWASDVTRPDYVSHVAIYLGGGKMLEAPETGAVVRIAAIRPAHFIGVTRVAP